MTRQVLNTNPPRCNYKILTHRTFGTCHSPATSTRKPKLWQEPNPIRYSDLNDPCYEKKRATTGFHDTSKVDHVKFCLDNEQSSLKIISNQLKYMNYYKLPLLPIILLLFSSAYSQNELRKVIPPSPTVASLGKYGDMPVSNYTGIPTISIPLHEIKSNNISLPISLSYHASGIKVEEIASWVGLGWSLNAGGIITRSVRGIPDEIGNGFLNPAITVEDYMNMPENTLEQSLEKGNLCIQMAEGVIDVEADIFYFNFGTLSGKFFYNQKTGEFRSIPRDNIFIDKNYFLSNHMWRIVSNDGTQYFFELSERNLTYSECNGNASPASYIDTGWFLTKIMPVTGGEINFIYDEASYSMQNMTSRTITDTEAGITTCGFTPNQVCNSTNTYSGFRLKTIIFDQGRIEFIAQNDRCDVIGDKRLDAIEIYNSIDTQPFKKFTLKYSYFNQNLLPNGQCGGGIIPENVRLKLVSVAEKNKNEEELPPYTFEYDESFPLPSLFSYAQDIWGYYNGANQNTTLVPPYFKWSSYTTLMHDGADRTVDTTKTSVGTLKTLHYPTGGQTTFEFENNKIAEYPISAPFVDSKYLYRRNEIIDTSNPCNQNSNIFCKNVTVNDQRGTGAFISFRINGMYCWDCTQHPLPAPTSCAVLSLKNSENNIQIVCDGNNVFVPNGEYSLHADFSNSSSVSDYENFSIQIIWEEYNPPAGYVDNVSVGGLRVKKITDSDGSGLTKSKVFNYNDDLNRSTGVLVLNPSAFNFAYSIPCRSPAGGVIGTNIIHSSFSNVPISSSHGSIVGYSKVTVFGDVTGQNGKSVFYFSNSDIHPDVPAYGFPYAPTTGFEHRRGLLLKQDDYRFNGNSYTLIKQVENEYKPLDLIFDWEEPVINNTDPLFEVGYSLKAGIRERWNDGLRRSLDAFPAFVYKNITEWVRSVKTTERTYDDAGNYLETITNNEYGNTLHLQPTKTTKLQSDGTQILNYLKYPLDYTPGSSGDAGIKILQDKHMVTPVIESITTQKDANGNEAVLRGILTTYDNKPLPNTVYSIESKTPIGISEFVNSTFDVSGNFKKDLTYKSKILFTKFDYSNGNLLEQQKDSNVLNSYIWGYAGTLPIAEVQNASYDSIFHTSFEDDGVVFEGTGGTNLAKTGQKVLNTGSYTIPTSFAPSSATKLNMSYWYWNTNKWNFSGEIPFNRNISSSGTKLDEIRVYPKRSIMTTYTYKVGIGISSVTDANHVTSYYEYDTFGRLQYIKDEKGNLLKSYKYNYKIPQSSQQ